MSRIIAMWSGPRNISTAMMRAFENRPDCAVWDEPFYAWYLKTTGLDHPMAGEIIAHHETDAARISAALIAPPADGSAIHYQKHMAHHMIVGAPTDWFARASHAFLIRDPARVIASYAAKRERVNADDLGFRRQWEIFRNIAEQAAEPPPVLDAADVLADPEGLLRQLCRRLEIEFHDCMLAWPPGPRNSDGIWARHWYASVNVSQGFSATPGPTADLPADLAAIAEECRPYYEEMHASRLRPAPSGNGGE